jgi:hypothetical protein
LETLNYTTKIHFSAHFLSIMTHDLIVK